MLPSLNNSAEALTSTSSAVKAGNGAELWDSSNKRFNPIVINDLRTKLFGTEDPVTYIKDNGAYDYNTYGKNSLISDVNIRNTPYYVVPSSTINANSRINNTAYGLVLTLDNKEWIVTSLTLDKDENVILTLYLADDFGTSQFNSNGSNTKGNNVYSCSTIRNHLLNHENWSLFNSLSFAGKFLVQPKNIQYQITERSNGRANGISSYTMPNESVGNMSTSGWYSSGSSHQYHTGETYNGVLYEAWGDDYIWIPSGTETGYVEYLQNSSIWRLSGEQLKHSAATAAFRIADTAVYNNALGLTTDGKFFYGAVTTSFAVRPAIHLNFSAAELAVGTVLDDPENMTTTYNGNSQTVKSVVDADSTKYTWYNSEWYEHTDNYINLTYQDSKGSTVASVKDAGEYWVKAEITDNWINAVNTEVEEDRIKYGWTDAQKDEAKKNRKPKFDGDPDTSDAAHTESDIVRWFKFTIKPAELEIPTVAEPSKTYTGSDIEFAISGYDSAKMTATPPAGFTLSDDGKIYFKNANTYTINISIKDNNYCWKGTSDDEAPDRSAKTINITVTQKGIIINFTSSSGKFTMAVGENVTFTAVASAADVAAGDTVTPTITYYKGSDTANVSSATGAELNASGLSTGTYTLGAKLENKDGTANGNYKITSVTPKTVTVGSKTITIENVTWQYEQDDEYTSISGDSVVLTYNGKEFKFSVKETTEELRAKGVKIDSYSGNIQKNATDGTVTVKVKLVPYDESFEFENSTQTEVEFSLTVTINRAKIDFNKLVWSAAPTNQLEYTGNTQTVTIVSGIPSFYDVTYRDNSGLSVKTYETKILSIIPKTDSESVAMAANYSVEQKDYKDYTYTWEIVKKKIEAKWTNVAHTTTDGKTVYIPEITGADAGVLKYEYTTDPDGETKELSEILSSYSETQISYYIVTVTIDSAYAASYELVDSAYVVQPSASQNFAVGNNKKSVTVSLQETKVYFNNQPQAVKLSYTGEGIILGDFAVEYKLLNADGSEGEATNTAPTAVGKYKVTITLQGEKANTHIIVGENVFEYIIAHKDRFILTAAAAASHPYKFLYEDFHEYEQDIKEYLYNAEDAGSAVYIAHLAFEDTLADLLKQFANAEDITVYGADGVLIEDMTTLLATGMMLRMMDGETVLNQLTISVMGDIDGDGDIGTADKARLNSYTLGNLELKGASLLACDLDGDGEVGTADKARLNAYTLGNLDIYVGLILRATAQATSATEESVFAASAQATSKAFTACDEPMFVTSATTETTPLTTSAQTSAIYTQDSSAASECTVSASTDESEYETSVVTEHIDDCENAGDCEIACDIAIAGNVKLLLSNETASVYTSITDIKNIAFATSVYANRKQRM